MTTSRSNAEDIIRQHFAQWSLGNAAAVAQFYADGCVFQDLTLESRAEGPTAVREMVTAVCNAIPDLKWHLDLIAVDGQICTCECRFEGTLRKDLPGIPATHRHFMVPELVLIVLDNEKIRDYRGYWALATFLRQLGHSTIP